MRLRAGLGHATTLGTLLVALVVASSCQQADDTGTTREGGLEKTDLTIGLPVAASTFLPLYLADEDGLFVNEGLDIEFVTFRGGSDLIKAVVAGSVDIGITSLAGVTLGIAADQPLKAFYAGFNIPAFAWYAVPGIPSMDADAVRGKRLGVTRYGSSTDFLTRYVLVSRGLDPMRDVQIVQGGDSPTRLAAMDAGQLDINILNPPETYVAEDRGYVRILSQSDLADDYPFHVFFATERFIATHPKTLLALLRAHVLGVRRTKNDRPHALDVMIRRGRVDPQYADRSYDGFMPYIFEDGRLPSDRGLEVFFDMGVQAGQYDDRWPRDRYWLSHYVDTFDAWKP